MATSGKTWDPYGDRNRQLAQEVEREQLKRKLEAARRGEDVNFRAGGAAGGMSDDQRLAAQLAEQARAQREGSALRQQESTNVSNLEEQRKRDAAARALALFRSTGGGAGQLAVGAARGELA